jgi:hypothetical protein
MSPHLQGKLGPLQGGGMESLALNHWNPLSGLTEEAYTALKGMLGTQEEGEHLDFTIFKDRQDAEKKVAKSLCAFANTEGGVLIFGVETKEDASNVETASKLVPIPEAQKEAQWLKDRSRFIADPPIIGVSIQAICPSSLNGAGFIACYVPESKLAPHRTSGAAGFKWLMRTRTDCIDIPPSHLRRMFYPEYRVRMHAFFQNYEESDSMFVHLSQPGSTMKRFTMSLCNLGQISARDASFTAWLSWGELHRRKVGTNTAVFFPNNHFEELGGPLHPTVTKVFDLCAIWSKPEPPVFHLKVFAIDMAPQKVYNVPIIDLTTETMHFALEPMDLEKYR